MRLDPENFQILYDFFLIMGSSPLLQAWTQRAESSSPSGSPVCGASWVPMSLAQVCLKSAVQLCQVTGHAANRVSRHLDFTVLSYGSLPTPPGKHPVQSQLCGPHTERPGGVCTTSPPYTCTHTPPPCVLWCHSGREMGDGQGEGAHHMEQQDDIIGFHGILITFIELSILIPLNQLKRMSVAKIGAQLFFGGSGPEDTIIRTDKVRAENTLDAFLLSVRKVCLETSCPSAVSGK